MRGEALPAFGPCARDQTRQQPEPQVPETGTSKRCQVFRY